MRTAAVADFLVGLRARGSADLNSLLATLNDGGLVRESLAYWKRNGWIALAPDSPLLALAGPRFDRRITLREFCGADAPATAPDARDRDEGEDGIENEDP